jgi:alkaline phosphatase D
MIDPSPGVPQPDKDTPMGRPSFIKPHRAGANRRDFFKRSGSAAALLAGASALSLRAVHAASATPSGVFQHGVASGDPLARRVILWTRVTPAAGTRGHRLGVQVEYIVATDPALQNIVTVGRAWTNAGRDFTVKVDATGLKPATTYYYRFSAEGEHSAVGRTKTLPFGKTASVRMAVVSCSNFAYGHFNAYRRIAERADLDMVVHLGDYLYEYGSGEYGTARACEPPTEIVSLADYRMRHAQYKRDADSQQMHRQHPLVAIWDDHEVANNSWEGGAENHQPATEGDWATRVANALQAYCEWMPVRVADPTNLRKNNRSFRIGNLVDLIMLEERLNARSQQLTTNIGSASGYFTESGAYLDASRQLLGQEEESWLFGELRSSRAKWKVIGQGVMFAPLKAQGAPLAGGGGVFLNSDQWDGYQPARDRVFDVLKGTAEAPAVGNVVVLTGDIHSSWAADLTQDPNNTDVSTGGYNAVTGEGSHAVEFVGTSVTSPGVSDPTGAIAASLKPANPHFKYINLDRNGYMLLDVTEARAVCEWWFVDTVASQSNIQAFATALQTEDGNNRLVPAAQTSPRPNPPPLAP